MVKLSVMYPNQPDARFDNEYYLHTHMPMVARVLGPLMKRGVVDRGLPTPEGPAPYLYVAHLFFESMENFQAAMAQHGATLQADIPNYTDIRPVIQLSEVVTT
jgi:uncharacterized protein (TIGR02118 family)